MILKIDVEEACSLRWPFSGRLSLCPRDGDRLELSGRFGGSFSRASRSADRVEQVHFPTVPPPFHDEGSASSSFRQNCR